MKKVALALEQSHPFSQLFMSRNEKRDIPSFTSRERIAHELRGR